MMLFYEFPDRDNPMLARSAQWAGSREPETAATSEEGSMIPCENGDFAMENFDRVLRAALRQGLRGQEPSARVRESLLRAAAAQNQPMPDYWHEARAGLWRDSGAQAPSSAQMLIDILHADLYRTAW
ncbi:MAG: hypothetical protein ACRDGG_01130 [Anaerolineae bacterium]